MLHSLIFMMVLSQFFQYYKPWRGLSKSNLCCHQVLPSWFHFNQLINTCPPKNQSISDLLPFLTTAGWPQSLHAGFSLRVELWRLRQSSEKLPRSTRLRLLRSSSGTSVQLWVWCTINTKLVVVLHWLWTLVRPRRLMSSSRIRRSRSNTTTFTTWWRPATSVGSLWLCA